MNIIQLRCFMSVAEYLSFARASEQLNMTQPAISHQIASLEKELDTKLFIRTTRTVRLTEEGKIFLSDAKKIVRIAFGAKSRIQHHAQESIQAFNVGIHSSMELHILITAFKNLTQSFPYISPNIKMLPEKSLRNALETEDIQALLSYQIVESVSQPGIYVELCQCPLACVMLPDHPLSSRAKICLEDLENEYLILYETHKNPAAIAQLQTDIIEKHAPNRFTFTDNPSCALTLVLAGSGISIIPDSIPLRHPKLCYIPLEGWEAVSYGLYYHHLKEQPALKQFITELKEIFSP